MIDEGMRRWCQSCYPDIKAAVDAERAAKAEAPVVAGIYEIAETQEVATP